MGHLQDCDKQRQHVGQRLGVAPVSGRKNRYDRVLGGSNFAGHLKARYLPGYDRLKFA